jgi:hypothetical protein
MSMSDLERFFELIEEHEAEADFEGPKPMELIEKAEMALGLSFSPMYRKFVERLGCGDIAGFEIYGVLSEEFENSSIPNGIWLTLDERKSSNMPTDLLLVSDVGDGSYYALDYSQKSETGEIPVVIWTPTGTRSEPVHEDFGAFARDRLEAAVS